MDKHFKKLLHHGRREYKNMHIFIMLQQSVPSANSGPPHLRNSFYLTSQKRKAGFCWHFVRKHACNLTALWESRIGRRPKVKCKCGERAGNTTEQDPPFNTQGSAGLGKNASKHFFTFRGPQSPSGHTAPMIAGPFRDTVSSVSCGKQGA